MIGKRSKLLNPRKLGVTEVSADITTLRQYIDWTPFFMTWSLAGKYPRILQDEIVGAEATQLFEDANALLDRLEQEGGLVCKGVFGLFAANSVDERIVIENDSSEIFTAHHLRQQTQKPKGFNYCLSDYIAPADSGRTDYIGAFAVTGGIGEDELAKSFENVGDDYNSIMVKAIADRLAEAFAEYLHQQVREIIGGTRQMSL